MGKSRIEPQALRAFLEAGHSQADAAKRFGVSAAAISQRVKALRIATTKVMALEHAGTIVAQNVSATERLNRVQRVIDRELAVAVEQAERPGADRAALVDVILRLAGEVRQQLGLQLSISRALVDMRVVREFQETVVETIRQESPETARRIVARLKERRALRSSAELPSLTGGDADGCLA